MPETQKQIAATLAIIFLFFAVAITVWLAATAGSGSFALDSNRLDSPLRFPWNFAAFFMHMGTGTTVFFASVITILTTAIGWVTGVYQRPWQIWTLALLSVTGIIAAIWILTAMTDQGLVQISYYGQFHNHATEVEDNIAVGQALNSFAGGLIGWFALFLATQLGISLLDKDGAVRKLLDSGAGNESKHRGGGGNSNEDGVKSHER